MAYIQCIHYYNYAIRTLCPCFNQILSPSQYQPPCSLSKSQCRDFRDKHASTSNDGSSIQLTSHCRLYRCSNYMVDRRQIYFLSLLAVGRTDPLKCEVAVDAPRLRHFTVKLVWAKLAGIRPSLLMQTICRLVYQVVWFLKDYLVN